MAPLDLPRTRVPPQAPTPAHLSLECGRDRGAEQDVVSRGLGLWLSGACGIAAPSPKSLLEADEAFEETIVATVDSIDQLLAGEIERVTAQPDGPMSLSAPLHLVLL